MANEEEKDYSSIDALIVGGGPSGSSCAYWLAKSGWNVVVVEKKSFPREKTCGDGLTPRSVKQLQDMGLNSDLDLHHKYSGLRAVAFGKTLELNWPETPNFPTYGYCVTRYNLDQMVADNAVKSGAALLVQTEALEPIFAKSVKENNQSRVVGVRTKSKSGETKDLYAKFLVVADGANSRIGRSLGMQRDKSLPMGMAIRGYFNSPRSDDPWIESHLDIRDENNRVIPGYGWIFPLGDGRVNVGAGLLNVNDRWKGFNTTKLMEAFVRQTPKSWGISQESSLGAPTGGRLPMGLSIGPRSGAGWLSIGDSQGSINPFNGEGIAYGYETGRLAATYLDKALRLSDDLKVITTALTDDVLNFKICDQVLKEYDLALEENYRSYYRVASFFVEIISHPSIMKVLVGTGMRSKTIMTWVLRIMANLTRENEHGPAELILSTSEWFTSKTRKKTPSTLKF